MAFMIASIILLHGVSLACLLFISRHSVMLVDEDGRPIRPVDDWHVRVVPRQRAPRADHRHT
jgi:hypothetical protein